MNKKITNICGILFCALAFTACEIDNYDAPDAGLEGKFINKVTGENIHADQGQGNMKLRIKEISFANGDETVVVTEQNLNVMQDGTFKNTRLFAGTYEMYPFETCCYEGKEIMQEVVLKSGKSTKLEFEVTPYFDIQWQGDPYQDADGYLYVDFTFENNPLPSAEYTQAVADKATMHVSRTKKISSDGRYTPSDFDVVNKEGSVVTLKSRNPIEFSQKLWIRIGVKPKNNTSAGVFDKWCYSSIKEFEAKGTVH